MNMISGLAPLLPHMQPGDVKGFGSHAWMMKSLPDIHQGDWALELIGSMIKYPFAVEIFTSLVSCLKPNYTANSLVDALLETVAQAARRLTPRNEIGATDSGASRVMLHHKTSKQCRRQMVVLDAQGVCRFQGLPRIFKKLGLMRKLTSNAAEALSHRLRGRVRQKNGKRQSHKHAGKKLALANHHTSCIIPWSPHHSCCRLCASTARLPCRKPACWTHTS